MELLDSEGHGLTLVADEKNRTKLQAVLAIRIDHCPSSISFSGQDDDQLFEITLSIHVKWSIDPSRPVTIFAAGTPIGTVTRMCKNLSMHSLEEPREYLLQDPLAFYRIGWREPNVDDWREVYEFITIPSQASGKVFQKKQPISRQELLCKGPTQGKPTLMEPPRVGTEFELKLKSTPTDFRNIRWWNFGDLEDDLKDRKFVMPVNPKLNDSTDFTPPPYPQLMSIGCWDDVEDAEGNEMVYLEVEKDQTPFIVKIVE